MSYENTITALADPTRVRQVVRNLATNAIRHGGHQRRVTVRQVSDQAVVEVRDDGDPIPPALQTTMFDPYERTRYITSTRPESVGLGLTVARSLVASMGGELHYEHASDPLTNEQKAPPRFGTCLSRWQPAYPVA